MDVTIVEDFGKVKGSGARQCLVQRGDEFFVVSTVTAFDTGRLETLAFRADAKGKITNWTEVAGGIGKHREEVIAQLQADGPKDEGIDGFRDEIVDANGGFLGLTLNVLSGNREFDEGDEI
jgi:hypothetical protein